MLGTGLNFWDVNPIQALFWTAVINGFVAPPLLVVIMLASNNPAIVGNRTNGRGLNLVGWATTAAMFLAAIGLVVRWVWQ